MENGDWDGMSDRKWREQTGKLPPVEAAQAAVDRIAAWRSTLDEELERIGRPYDAVRAQVQAERRFFQERGLCVPAWKADIDGVPTDRDVWAYLAVYDGEDEVELIRGRVDGRRFDLAGSDGWDDRDVANIICWIEVKDRPAFSLAVAKATATALERLERLGNGHAVEDWLHREALRAVVAGHPDAQAIAAAALESRAVKFTRYYS